MQQVRNRCKQHFYLMVPPGREDVAEDEILSRRSNQHRGFQLPSRVRAHCRRRYSVDGPDQLRPLALKAATKMQKSCKHACAEDLGSNSNSFRTSRVRPLRKCRVMH